MPGAGVKRRRSTKTKKTTKRKKIRSDGMSNKIPRAGTIRPITLRPRQPTAEQVTLMTFRRYQKISTAVGVITNDANPYFTALAFKVNDYVPSSTMQAYEAYRIKRVKVTFFRVHGTAIDARGADTLSSGTMLFVWPDFDDANVTGYTDLSDILNKEQLRYCQITDQVDPLTIEMKPVPLNTVNSTASFGAGVAPAIPKMSPWITTLVDSVPHYGLKIAMLATSAQNNDPSTIWIGDSVQVIVEMDVEFRGHLSKV